MSVQKLFQALCLILLASYASLRAGNWSTAPPMLTPRVGAAAVALDGFIYVMGGMTANNVLLNTVERFDPATGQWDSSAVPPFPIPRADAAAIVYQQKIYLLGGWDGSGKAIRDVQVYDPVQNTWSTAQEMREKRAGHNVVILQDYLCVFGGLEQDYNYVDEIEYFDGSHWEKSDSEIVELRAAAFGGALDSTMYMLGGFYLGPTATGFEAHLLEDWGFFWQNTQSLSEPRAYGVSIVAGDSLYMIGGETLSGVTGRLEILNMATGQIHSGPPMPTPRRGAAGALWDHRIYVMGGITAGQNQPTSLVEVYTDSALTAVQEAPTATRLPGQLALLRAYPNPFNGTIQLQIELKSAQQLQLAVLDLLGREVSILYQGRLAAGTHTFQWNAQDPTGRFLPSGIYLVSLKGPNWVRHRKVVYVK